MSRVFFVSIALSSPYWPIHCWIFWPIVQLIDYWHHPVIRLSVRLSVTLCIVALRVGVQTVFISLSSDILQSL